jgi:hypothetical protein
MDPGGCFEPVKVRNPERMDFEFRQGSFFGARRAWKAKR